MWKDLTTVILHSLYQKMDGLWEDEQLLDRYF